jgi:hypothetical protein
MHRRHAEMLSRAALSADDLPAAGVTLRRLERFWIRAADLVQRPQPLAPDSPARPLSPDARIKARPVGCFRSLSEGAALAVASDGDVERRQSRKSFGPVAGDRGFESISLQQTVRLSPAATFERQEPGLSPQVCEVRLTTGSAETQQAFHCAPTGGNVSAGPYSSTAVLLMRSAAMPRRSERSGVSGL